MVDLGATRGTGTMDGPSRGSASSGAPPMIAVDTPVLLDLLRGREPARKLLEEAADEEIATTELNLFELHLLSEGLGKPGVERRRAALENLRRRLTVLPVDESAANVASRTPPKGSGWSPTTRLVLSTLESHGCGTWHTLRSVARPGKLRTITVVEYKSAQQRN
ncbi:MAG: type II toxin-antitoxin system VapC family toxin [Thermoplasmata archaeon]|nr:type II toxin-antitoxin system VapC family toxin [Thermoplasmata archaeon]